MLLFYIICDINMITSYMADWLAFSEKKRAEQSKNPPPVIERLRVLKEQRYAKQVKA